MNRSAKKENSIRSKGSKENLYRSPISPKNFQQRLSLPDLWTLSDSKLSAEEIFDRIFPSPVTRKLPYYQFDRLSIEGVNLEYLWEKAAENDWIQYNTLG